MSEATVPPGTVLDDKFRVERVLGIGGMGAVYEITHLITQHRRALKLLHAHVASKKVIVDRFLREASAAGRIGNPHIVETFDAGWLSTGEPYLVMEMLEGQTLDARIEEMGGEGLPVAEVVEIFEQLSNGVQAAHDAGITHRDLKPENVFLSSNSEGETFVRVLDFGISKFDDAFNTRLTAGGAVMGTPAYMSPEQFEDSASTDQRTDIYALGVMLYELLTGQHPYPATTLTQLVARLMEPRQVSVSEGLGLPASLDRLLEATMSKLPEQRPESAVDLIDQVRRILSHPSPRVALPATRPRGGQVIAPLPPSGERPDGERPNPVRVPAALDATVALTEESATGAHEPQASVVPSPQRPPAKAAVTEPATLEPGRPEPGRPEPSRPESSPPEPGRPEPTVREVPRAAVVTEVSAQDEKRSGTGSPNLLWVALGLLLAGTSIVAFSMRGDVDVAADPFDDVQPGATATSEDGALVSTPSSTASSRAVEATSAAAPSNAARPTAARPTDAAPRTTGVAPTAAPSATAATPTQPTSVPVPPPVPTRAGKDDFDD